MSASVRILVVKTSSLGDVVHALPAISDIAAALPDAVIDWVCEEKFAGIPALHAAVSRVIPCAIRRWRRSLWSAGERAAARREIAAFRSALTESTYDIAIDLQGLVKSAWIIRQARATRHGYTWGSAREPIATLAYDVRHRVEWNQHAIARNRQLTAAALRYTPEGPVRYGLAGLAPVASKRTEDRYVVALHATSRADKLWPEASWRELIGRLSMRGLRIVLPWGTDGEQERSERLAAGARSLGRAEVPPQMDMRALAALFAGAEAVIGVDTGLVHLAVAAGAPSIAIFGPTRPALTGVVAERAPAIDVGGDGAMPDVDRVDEALRTLLQAAAVADRAP